jgi:2-phosphosulfolactate phosphatase
MIISRATLATCSTATGLVVAIDVLRAFTTAAYLFEAGVSEIILVSSVSEALRLKDELPGSLTLGEIDGIKVDAFDLGNSPSQLPSEGLGGRRIIQRTTAGTQGVVLASRAETILAAALTNASATARCIQNLAPPEVTLIQTGLFPQQGWGDEDVACADLIEGLLLGRSLDLDEIARRVRASRSGLHYDGTRPHFPPPDLDLALQVDRFDFAMQVERANGLHVLHAVQA